MILKKKFESIFELLMDIFKNNFNFKYSFKTYKRKLIFNISQDKS